jgi:protein-tyrosine phosphatase
VTLQTDPVAFSILYVCTGNICRSPLAERLTRLRLTELLGQRAAQFEVSSVGVRGLVGRAMDVAAAAQLRRLGGDPDGFSARALTAPVLQRAGLVLTATRAHRSRVLEEEPRALRRTFTIREFAGLVEGATAASPADLVADAAGRRTDSQVGRYDVADPIGAPDELHAQVADTIDVSVTTLVAALVGTVSAAR